MKESRSGKTNGGLMYYNYDGMRNVTELTDRHGETVEKYCYDAFGGLYTGVTAPYNTIGYAGRQYDPKANLVDMHARWYAPQNGRFTTPDSYRWDPTGNWMAGDETLSQKAQDDIFPLGKQWRETEDQALRDTLYQQANNISSDE